jgi:hypothetical protein
MVNFRKLAEGRVCQVRLPGCQHDYGVVLAHYRLAGTCGIGMKPHDLQGAWACFSCHNRVDARGSNRTQLERLAHAEGVLRTQQILRSEGHKA